MSFTKERPPRVKAKPIPMRYPTGAVMMTRENQAAMQNWTNVDLERALAAERDELPPPTRLSREHMGRVAALGCIACRMQGSRGVPAEVHHIREGRQARNDFLTVPLCPDHHRGSRMSVHHDKAALLRALAVSSEFDLLARVIELLEPR